MTYNLLVVDALDRPRLTAALASLISVPIDSVDLADADDYGNRNWDAAVSCIVEQLSGDVTWGLDIYLTEAIRTPPTEPQAAVHLAEQLGAVVLYPANEALPSAYWLAAPGGVRTRARLETLDENDHTVYRIDAVEKPVPTLPSVPATPLPEVIREHRMSTPLTEELQAWLATATGAAGDAEETLWFAHTRLGAWESLTARIAAGWPPDGWYPAEFYREDLATRDELAIAMQRLSATVAERFRVALTQVDENFRAATVEADDAQVSAGLGVSKIDLSLHDWWWHRLPAPLPWPKTS